MIAAVRAFSKMSESERALVPPYGLYTDAFEEAPMSEQSTPARTHEQEQVEYRDLPGFPGYRVGDDGSIWSNHRSRWHPGMRGLWHRLKLTLPHGRSHLRVNLNKPGERSQYRRGVHRLVLEAFVGPCPEGMQCCHADGDPTNNRLSNLRWDTQESNYADRSRHGTDNQGERNGRAKLDAATVRVIRELAAAGHTKAALARQFRVGWATVRGVINREIWRHV